MFNVGDIITGNNKADEYYSYTTSDSVCKVIRLLENKHDDILVEIIEHSKHPSRIGSRYEVRSDYFNSIEKIFIEVIW